MFLKNKKMDKSHQNYFEDFYKNELFLATLLKLLKCILILHCKISPFLEQTINIEN
jgi:hypothetical protein